MARKKKKKQSGVEVFFMFIVPVMVVLFLTTFIHYMYIYFVIIKKPYRKRVFDVRLGVQTFWVSTVLLLMVGFVWYAVYDGGVKEFIWLASAVAIIVFWYAGKLVAYSFMGMVVDAKSKTLYIPPKFENLDIKDYFLVWPVVKKMLSIDEVDINLIDNMTRAKGKHLYLHGNTQSRMVVFSNKLKRDQAMMLISAVKKGNAKILFELE